MALTARRSTEVGSSQKSRIPTFGIDRTPGFRFFFALNKKAGKKLA
jgi:hypothetical protein